MLQRTLRVTVPPMRGPDVTQLQRLLNRKGFPCAIDGKYGPETAGRVVEAKRRLHYPKFRQLSFAGATFFRLLPLLPDANVLVLPQFFLPTHQTGGLPGFPAIDVFAKPRTVVCSPEAGTLTFRHMIQWNPIARVGGFTCYFQGVSGDTYFLTHFGQMEPEGHYTRGQVIGTVAAVPGEWWAPHIHEGKHHGRYVPNL